MRRHLFKSFLALLFLYALSGFWLLPLLIQTQLPPLVKEATLGSLQIDGIDFNPFFMEMHIEGITYNTPEEAPLFTLQEGYVNLDLSALLLGEIRFYAIRMKQPQLYVVKGAEGFNFDWLLHLPRKPEPAAAETAPLPPLKLLLFAIEEGALHYSDQEREFILSVEPIGFSAHRIDLRQSDASQQFARLHAELSDGGSIDVKSHLRSLSPLVLDGSIDLQGIKPYTAWRYGKDALNIEVADGTVTMYADYRYDANSPKTARIENLTARLENMRIKPKTRHYDLLRLQRLSVAPSLIEPFSSRVSLGGIALEGLYLAAQRDKEGRIDWEEYLRIPSSTDKEASTTGEAPQTQSPWKVTAEGIDLNGSSLHFTDHLPPLGAAAHITEIALHTGTIDSTAGTTTPFELTMRINGEGMLDSNGTLAHTPPALSAQVGLSAVPMNTLTPYLQEASYLDLTDGTLSAQSRIGYTASEASPLKLRADVTMENFRLADSRNGSELASWRRLALNDISATLHPPRIQIETITLKGAHLQPRINTNDRLNLATLQKTATAAVSSDNNETNATATAAPQLTIGSVAIDDASVEFSDDSLPLPYQSRLHEINGRISDISFPAGSSSQIDMTMSVDDYASFKIDGSVLGSDPIASTDLSLELENFALQSITPYSAKFIGRAVDGGKLLLNLRYRLDKAKLNGDNIVTIERIRLGKSVNSPAAMHLPLELAIALLEDKDGLIEIDLPVRGDVNAPDFRFGKLLMHAFSDLIVKATTAPFRFLAAMLGNNEASLDTIAFGAGSSVLLPKEREKLDTLAQALQKRPRLKLQLSGCYERESDMRMLRLQQLYLEADALAGAGALDDAGEITLETLETLSMQRFGEEKLAALRDSHKEEERGSYRTALMQQTLSTVTLPSDALEALADERAAQIRDRLSQTGSVAQERLIGHPDGIAEKTRNCVMKLAF